MKPASGALVSLLATGQFYMVDLFTFNLVGGGVLRYCSGDIDITVGGNTFSAGRVNGPYFEMDGGRPLASWKAGLEVDQYTLDVFPKDATINGVQFQTAIKYGLFAGADFQCERAYMPTYGDTAAGTIIIFAGRVAEITGVGRTKATFNIKSHIEILNISLPRNLYQPGCVNNLGDTACGVNLAPYAVAGTVLTGSTASGILANLPQPSNYFSYGKLTFTSGANAGFSRGVRAHLYALPAQIALLSPFPVAPAIGDAFTVYPGCDKMMTTCYSKFSNIPRFRGQPFIPENSTAV